jgi:hypothetical protein
MNFGWIGGGGDELVVGTGDLKVKWITQQHGKRRNVK